MDELVRTCPGCERKLLPADLRAALVCCDCARVIEAQPGEQRIADRLAASVSQVGGALQLYATSTGRKVHRRERVERGACWAVETEHSHACECRLGDAQPRIVEVVMLKRPSSPKTRPTPDELKEIAIKHALQPRLEELLEVGGPGDIAWGFYQLLSIETFEPKLLMAVVDRVAKAMDAGMWRMGELA